jgi:maleylpyruvate isomerase
VLRVHRIPWSTNVERVEIALALKGVPYETVDHDPADRSAVRALSGQDLVPVVEDGGEVLFDSPAILRHLERRHPDPPLWPREPARAAEADVFVDWFNLVWKGPPNRIEALRRDAGHDREEAARLGAELAASRERFEALLDGRDFLLGPELGIADVIAHPFLRYALGCPPGDDEPFHLVLAEHLAPPPPRLRAWIDRVREVRAALGFPR